jgi:hypothetical protein
VSANQHEELNQARRELHAAEVAVRAAEVALARAWLARDAADRREADALRGHNEKEHDHG